VNTDASQEITTITKEIGMALIRVIGILVAAILIFGVLIRTVREEQRQQFMEAYGSCAYAVKMQHQFTTHNGQRQLLYLCLVGKGYDNETALEYLKDPRYRRENL